MIESIDAFLRYFQGIHQRTVRDVRALPPESDGWLPLSNEGEQAWSINLLIGHIAVTRLFFASAYCGEGWVSPPAPDVRATHYWVPVLEESFELLNQRLAGSPHSWLARRVPLLDTPGEISGWRVLMLLVEHEVHHRSQFNTYAGINGWPVPDLFGKTWEDIIRDR